MIAIETEMAVDGDFTRVLEAVDGKDNDNEEDGSQEYKVGHPVKALLEWCLFIRIDVHQGCSDLSNLGLHPGPSDNTLGTSLDYRGGCKARVEAISEILVGVLDQVQVLLNRKRLSGQKSLVCLEVEDLESRLSAPMTSPSSKIMMSLGTAWLFGIVIRVSV